MNPLNCYICDKKSVFYCKNIYKLTSKHSETLICDFIRKFLDNQLSRRPDDTESESIVCIECLNKIDEYDLACITVKRVEKELREILLRTESLHASSSSGAQIECINVDKIETCEIAMDTNDSASSKSISEHASMNNDDAWDDNDDDSYDEPYSRQDDEIEATEEESTANKESKEDKSIRLQCNVCNLNFKTLNGMRQHKHVQENSTLIDEVLTNRPFVDKRRSQTHKFKCTVDSCEEVFNERSKLKEHIRIHQGRFRCRICGIIEKSESELSEHKVLHENLDPLDCVLCKKRFKKKGALTRHMRIHAGEKFYQCDKCGKEFVHKSSFNMHIMAHDNIRDKSCPHCPLKFRSTSHLNRHIRIHTGAKPYACPECGQRFAQRYNMSVHFRLHKGADSQNIDKCHLCSICGTRFSRATKLAEHYRKAHETLIPHTTIGNNLDHSNEVKGKGIPRE